MPIMILTLLVVLVLAVVIIAVVVMGMEGTGKERHPEIANAMARTARHLNGEGEPPKALVNLIDEFEEAPRDLPNKLRSLRSARSAVSAASAGLPEDAEPTPAGQPVAADARGKAEPSDEPVAAEATAPQQVPVAGGTPSEAPTETAPRDAQPAREPEQGAAPVSEADEGVSSDPVVEQLNRPPVQRSGKRRKNRKRAQVHAVESSGRAPLTIVPDASAQTVAPRPSPEELNESLAAALSAPAVDDPDAADPYGVWGADELDPEPAPAQQRVHLGRGRRA
jgi:hypothetical protein